MTVVPKKHIFMKYSCCFLTTLFILLFNFAFIVLNKSTFHKQEDYSVQGFRKKFPKVQRSLTYSKSFMKIAPAGTVAS